MPEKRYDVAVIGPQYLLGLGLRSHELDMLPVDAYQRDLDESRVLMESAYNRAFEAASRTYGVHLRSEFHRFIPDEADGRAGPVHGVWELVGIVIDSGVPVDVLANLIADALTECAKELVAGLILIDTLRPTDQQTPSRRYTAEGIKAYCVQHSERINPGLQSSQAQVLMSHSKTSISNYPFVVTVDLGVKKLTYTIGPDGEPLSIVEATEYGLRSLSTDKWREWYLPIES